MRALLRGARVPDSQIHAWPSNFFNYAKQTAQIYFYAGGTH